MYRFPSRSLGVIGPYKSEHTTPPIRSIGECSAESFFDWRFLGCFFWAPMMQFGSLRSVTPIPPMQDPLPVSQWRLNLHVRVFDENQWVNPFGCCPNVFLHSLRVSDRCHDDISWCGAILPNVCTNYEYISRQLTSKIIFFLSLLASTRWVPRLISVYHFMSRTPYEKRLCFSPLA